MFLKENCSEATDYKVLCILIQWCHANNVDITEFLYYLDFPTYAVDEKRSAIATGKDPVHLLLNALHMFQILESNQMNCFDLGDERNHWKLFHRNGIDLVNPTSPIQFPSSLKSNLELTICTCTSLHDNFEPDVEDNANDRIDIYGSIEAGAS